MADRVPFSSRKEHAVAYAGIVAWLKDDPVLRRDVKTWRDWSKPNEDGNPWAVGNGVGLRITPELGPAEAVATDGRTRIWSRPLDLSIEGVIPGWTIAEGMDLAAAVAARLFPQTDALIDSLDAKLADWGATELIELQPLRTTGDENAMATFEGRYRLEMLLDG